MIKVIESPQRIRTLNVALLGCGTVGQNVAKMLLKQADAIAGRTGIAIRLRRVLVRDRHRDRGIDRRFFTDRFQDLARDEIDVCIELLGGLDPAANHVRHLLENGISVVTANKTLIAHHGQELTTLAAANGVSLAYEASVCAAVPVLSSLKRLQGDHVRSITGIVNGACNDILTRMTETGLSLGQALIEARQLGLVEPDPSADLSGRDSAEKLSILSSIANFGEISPQQISVHGIEHVTGCDILFARRRGCVIKLLAQLRSGRHGVTAIVRPVLLSKSHAMASVHHENNALLIDTELGGELLLQGKGAGPCPTASAVLSDVLAAADGNQECVSWRPLSRIDAVQNHDQQSAFYVRMTAGSIGQRPRDVLSALRLHGIEIDEIDFAYPDIAVLTHPTTVSKVEHAVNCIDSSALRRMFLAQRMPM